MNVAKVGAIRRGTNKSYDILKFDVVSPAQTCFLYLNSERLAFCDLQRRRDEANSSLKKRLSLPFNLFTHYELDFSCVNIISAAARLTEPILVPDSSSNLSGMNFLT